MSSRFTVTLSSLDGIQQAIRSAARNAGDAADNVVSLSTCDNNRGWEHNAEIARKNIEKARKMLSSVSPDLSNLAAQVGERKTMLQNLIKNPFVSGAFGPSDPLFVGLLSHSIYDDPFFNPNRPPRPPKKGKEGNPFIAALPFAGMVAVADSPAPGPADAVAAAAGATLLVGAGLWEVKNAISNAAENDESTPKESNSDTAASSDPVSLPPEEMEDLLREKGFTENPNRPGSWGKYDGPDGKYREYWRLDKGEQGKPGWRGQDHVHHHGGKRHLDPRTPFDPDAPYPR